MIKRDSTLFLSTASFSEIIMQVEQLLLSEPDNKEYEEIYHSLTEAITLTEELLKESGGATVRGKFSIRKRQLSFLSHLECCILPVD